LENKIPVCVQTCRPRALYAGNLEELKAKYGEVKEAVNFVYSDRTKPAIIFKPKKKA
jgi:Fe-S-cluster-containing dehydrogenase component